MEAPGLGGDGFKHLSVEVRVLQKKGGDRTSEKEVVDLLVECTEQVGTHTLRCAFGANPKGWERAE